MRLAFCRMATIAGLCLAGWALAAEDEDPPTRNKNESQQPTSKNLERLYREVRQLVVKYYPEASVTSAYDRKTETDNVHFQYNTQIFLMRFRGKDGSWQKPVEVRGPYAGGVWCDMALVKGRYAGDVENAEEGFTGAGPDYYSHLVAPYSKRLDRHLRVTVRFPGGTPPEFLKRLDKLVKDFENYTGQLVESDGPDRDLQQAEQE